MPRPQARERWLTYPLLFIGAVVFALPFVWLTSTSFKLDKELFRGQTQIIPERPNPREVSPYYDETTLELVDRSTRQFEALNPTLQQLIDDAGPDLPHPAQDSTAEQVIAAGAYERLRQRTPPGIWDGDRDQLLSFAANELTKADVVDAARGALRQLGIGSLRVRDSSMQEAELTATGSPSSTWRLTAPAVGTIADAVDNTLPFAAVTYDFRTGDSFGFEQTFQLPFPVSRLQRLQLRVRPDDTWHHLDITMEAAGVKYAAERRVNLADTRWTTVTLQRPSDDDHSTKLKTWLVFREVGRNPGFDHGPARMRVVLTVHQQSPLHAAFAKSRYNYQRVMDQIPFWRYVRVSVLLVILNIVLTVFSSSIVAYAFARLQWPGRDVLFLVMLGTIMIPSQVTMIPHFLIWRSVGAYDSLLPLFAGAAFGNAFFIFLMRQFLKGIPPDLEDAARIDGCGVLRIYWHVMLPLVKPSLAAIAIFTFMGTWNDFLGPLIYIADQRLYPLAFGLYAFSVQVESNPVLTMAASMLMTLPVLVVFFLTQRWFVQGITLTGMKG